jgi:hypothetical protein
VVTNTSVELDVGALADAYYDCWVHGIQKFNEARLREILATDLVFDGPIAGHRVGVEGFLRGLAGVAAAVRSFAVVQRLEQGNELAVIYDCELTRPAGMCRFAEFFRIEGGRIQSINLLYDATEWRKLSD